jgi:3D-(3,5/4)-trihydroxycyclohexane-1,2-dione acylhydrolase (decyclizing)
VLVIQTDPRLATAAGGHWWDVAVPEVSGATEGSSLRADYDAVRLTRQRIAD